MESKRAGNWRSDRLVEKWPAISQGLWKWLQAIGSFELIAALPTPNILNAAIVSLLTWKMPNMLHSPLRGYPQTVALCCTVPISCHSIPAPGGWWYVDGQRADGVNATLMTSVSEWIREKCESTPPPVSRIFFSWSFHTIKALLSVHLARRACLSSLCSGCTMGHFVCSLKWQRGGGCLSSVRDRRILQLLWHVWVCVCGCVCIYFHPKKFFCTAYLTHFISFWLQAKLFSVHSRGKSWEIINKSASRRGISSRGARYIKLNSDSRLSVYETLKNSVKEWCMCVFWCSLTFWRTD